MARYTTTEEFNFSSYKDERLLAVVGEVAVNVWDGDAFVPSDTVTDQAVRLFTNNTRIQIVPTGGASYYIDEENLTR